MADNELIPQDLPQTDPAPVETPAKTESPNGTETNTEGAPTAPASETAAPEPVSEDKGTKQTPKWAKDRFDELTRKRSEAERERDALKAERDIYKAMAEGKAPDLEQSAPAAPKPPQPGLTQADVERRAQQIAAQNEYAGKVKAWAENGQAEFKDFNDRCNLVASLGATDRPEFMQIITDMPDGHKIVAQLADHPEEATKILSLPPLKMASEIARFSLEKGKPAAKPISTAPAPIKPIDGAAKASDDLTGDEPMDAFAQKFWKRQAEKRKGARF